ncbi:HAD family hydrolase [Kocuria massiliensis]|uniref:HAD family hydrolase n=1 Tax=Kocuria massiliensis TaxID=1926282 RepID=UPI0022B94D35|nr:HAD family phosphatase [Kocuria massiliensis]
MTFLPWSAPLSPTPFDPEWTPTTVVFDCDGVLMDTERSWGETVARVSRELGLGDPHAIADKMTALPAKTIAEGLAREELPSGAPDDEVEGRGREILDRLSELDRQRIAGGVDLIPGAMDLLRKFADVLPVGVASNSSREILDAKLEVAGYKPFLGAWVSSDDVAHGKPAPDMYLSAIGALNGTPDRALTFEDSGPGAAAAVAAGTRVVALSDPTDSAPPAHFATSSFTEAAFLRQMDAWIG